MLWSEETQEQKRNRVNDIYDYLERVTSQFLRVENLSKGIISKCRKKEQQWMIPDKGQKLKKIF